MKEQPMNQGKRARRERIKLDQIMRVLFKLSKHMTVELINGLFNEQFISSEVDIRYGNSEFVTGEFNRIIGDLFITIEDQGKTYHFHIEFQILNDQTMVIRMFRYGFEKAFEHAISNDTFINKSAEKRVLFFPQQLVIFLEENEAIEESLSFVLQLPNGQELNYDVAVMKYCNKHQNH